MVPGFWAAARQTAGICPNGTRSPQRAMLQRALLGLQAGMQPAQPVVEILPRRKPATLSGLTGLVRDVMGRCPALADASEAEMDARPVAQPLAAALAKRKQVDSLDNYRTLNLILVSIVSSNRKILKIKKYNKKDTKR